MNKYFSTTKMFKITNHLLYFLLLVINMYGKKLKKHIGTFLYPSGALKYSLYAICMHNHYGHFYQKRCVMKLTYTLDKNLNFFFSKMVIFFRFYKYSEINQKRFQKPQYIFKSDW